MRNPRGPAGALQSAGLQELPDRQKINHAFTSYCGALDRCDVELAQSVCWEVSYDDLGVVGGNAK